MKRYLFYLLVLLCWIGSAWTCDLHAQAPNAKILQIEDLLLKAKQLESLPDSAIAIAQQALQLSSNEQYESGEIEAFILLSNLYDRQENFTESLRNLLQLIPILEQNGDELVLNEVYFQIGDIYLKEKLHEQALSYYRKVKKTEDNKIRILERTEASYAIGNLPDSALLVLDEIYNYYEEKKDYNGKVVSLEKQINNYLTQKNYKQALLLNQQLLELVTLEGDDHALAVAYNNIAYNYIKLDEAEKAIDNFTMAKVINDNGDTEEEATLNINMAICYQNTGDNENAIKFLKAAHSMLPNDAVNRQCAVHQLIAKIYLQDGDLYNADFYNKLAMEQAQYVQSATQLSATYRQAGLIHEELYEFEKALRFYTLHLQIQDSLKTIEKLRQQELLQQQLALEKAEKDIRLYQINEALKDAELRQANEEKIRFKLERDNLELQTREQQDRVALLEKDKKLQETLARSRERESEQAFLLLQQRLRTEEQESKVATLRQQEMISNMELERSKTDEKIQEQEIASLKREQDFNRLQIENQTRSTQLAYGIGLGLLLVSLLVFINLFRSRRANKRLSVINKEVEKQRKKSDELLLNILPEPTAIELKEKGSATPKKYELATVIFTDFSGFTNIAEQLTPEELIYELNTCFTTFDDIIEQYGLEKIKTLGDGYMCVGGVPTPDQKNPIKAVQAALEMQAFMRKNIADKKEKGIPYWEMRVGIHTGELVAGVVGSKKFAYDIWGDTVNTASRMESNGESGRINISKTTYKLVKDHFQCTYRGKLEVKNKGATEMYFVEA